MADLVVLTVILFCSVLFSANAAVNTNLSPSPTLAIPTINEGPMQDNHELYFFIIVAVFVAVIVLSILVVYLRDKINIKQKAHQSLI